MSEQLEQDIRACLPIEGDYAGGRGYIETDRMGIDASVASLVTLIHEREQAWREEAGRLKGDLHFAIQSQDEKDARIHELEKDVNEWERVWDEAQEHE